MILIYGTVQHRASELAHLAGYPASVGQGRGKYDFYDEGASGVPAAVSSGLSERDEAHHEKEAWLCVLC